MAWRVSIVVSVCLFVCSHCSAQTLRQAKHFQWDKMWTLIDTFASRINDRPNNRWTVLMQARPALDSIASSHMLGNVLCMRAYASRNRPSGAMRRRASFRS